MTKMLEFINVSLKKGGKSILDSISFGVKKGKITALIGKNGSGKSSLLNLANGLGKYSGEIRLCGKDIRKYSPRERAHLAAFLPQIMPDTALSVSSLISLGRTPYTGGMGILRDSDKEAVRRAMVLTNTEKLAERNISTLSGGEKRRVFLALLLAQETPLIILDEPTAYLDLSYSAELCTLLRELCTKHGKTVLVVMHELTAAIELCDDIALLDNGKQIFYGKREEILATHIIEDTFDLKKYTAQDGEKSKIFFS